MISEFFLDIVFGIVTGFFNLMPDITWSVETTSFHYFMDILRFAGYMFPWGTVTAICSIIVAISIFRVAVAFIRTMWSLLPFA